MTKPETITLYQVMTSHGMDDGPCGFHIWSNDRVYFFRREDADAYAAIYPIESGPRGAGRKVRETPAFRIAGEVYLGELHPVEPK